MGRPVAQGSAFETLASVECPTGTHSALLGPNHVRDTAGLWIAFLFVSAVSISSLDGCLRYSHLPRRQRCRRE